MTAMLPRWSRPLDQAEQARAERLFLERLARQLRHPPIPLTLADVPAHFPVDVVEAQTTLPLDMEDQPDLAIRVRGALGQSLASLPPPVDWRRDPHGRPRAFDILYQALTPDGSGLNMVKPMTVQTDLVGRKLTIRVNLVGMATYWWPDVAAGLQSAMEGGISLHGAARSRVPMEVESLRHHQTILHDLPDTNGPVEVMLDLLSPMRLRSGTATLFSVPSFLIALANRITALARWQHLDVTVDWTELHRMAHLAMIANDEMVAVRWDRGSVRSKGKIPVLGYMGKLTLAKCPAAYIPLLKLAELVNVGSHASLGFGRIKANFF